MMQKHLQFLEQAATRIGRFQDHPEFRAIVEDFKHRYVVGQAAYNRAKHKAMGDPALWLTDAEMDLLEEGEEPQRQGFELEKWDLIRIQEDGHCWWHEPLSNPLDCLLPEWFGNRYMSRMDGRTAKRSPVDPDEHRSCCAFLLAVIADRWGRGTGIFNGEKTDYWKWKREHIEEFYGLMTPHQRFDAERELHCGPKVRATILQAIERIEAILPIAKVAA